MRVEVTLVDPLWDLHRDVVVDADDTTVTGAVLDALVATIGTPQSADVISLAGRRHHDTGGTRHSTLYLHGEPIDPRLPIVESGIKHGALISVNDPSASLLVEPHGQVEVSVVTGPGAGAVHRLTPGEATIGSDPSCVIALGDDRVPPVCVTLTVRADGSAAVRPVEDAAAVLAETVPHVATPLAMERVALPADEDTEWPYGGQLTIGDVRLELAGVSAPDAAVEDSPDPGWCDYNRPPRLLPPERQTRFALPSPPGEGQSRGIPWLMVVAPMFLGGVMAIFFGPRMLMMAFFSPMMMIGNYLQSRKQGKQSYRQQLADYKDKQTRIEADVAQAVIDERQARRMEAPDPALVLMVAGGPRMRLWERRTTDPDYLSLRLGVGDLESEVTVADPEQLEHRRQTVRTAYDVPVTVPLAKRGVIGIAAPGDLPRRLATWAVAQLAVLQSPRDTQVYVLTDQAGAPAWDWLRWLPHAQPQLGQDTVVTLGVDTETCARRIAELSRILAQRQQAAADKDTEAAKGPDLVVVFDGARRLRSLPGVVSLLKQGPALGIYSIGLDTDERMLPEEADAVVLATPRGLTLRQQRVTVVDDITPDLVDAPWFNRVARMLAPIRDISGGDNDSVLPSACRLTEVMELEPLGADQVLARWTLSPRSTQATVGISLDGPFAIDLVKDGPHGLVAGTTGAGKSELLQSIVASLAIANRPDGMTFVLVDYKGGAAFKDCVDLPHTVGMVTDLDTHLVERALISLGAELTRREHLLALAEAKDIEDYVDVQHKRELPDMPRLLIVIDEFASLARELPEFVTGLVNIAQRGRSLGIHLILATQRPGGVVSPEIRANTNLRIALRVTDTAESTDVIDAPDSGLISKNTPGRAYVRLGAQSLVPFQSGRVGGRRPGVAATSRPWLTELGLDKLAQPIPVRPRASVVDDAEVTDLKVLVESVVRAAAQLGLPEQHSPWLPSLTTDVQLDELVADAPATAAPAITPLPYGIEDLPARQARRAAVIDFDTFSHLSVMGGPRSGRSQVLRTMAAAAGQLTSPADVHLFGLDCGNGALLPLQALPHCGAVVQRTQPDRAFRLLNRIMSEAVRRQELLSAGGYADLGELRASVPESERIPHILFLLDRWEGFMGSLAEAEGGRPYEQIQTLLREGASVGIHLVIAGDRQVCSSRMSALVEDKIGLRLPDKADYGLIGLHPKKLPDDVPEGRGFRSETGVELQVALLSSDPSGQAQAAELRRIGEEATARYADLPRSVRPFRVDVLPGRIGFEAAWAMRPRTAPTALWAMIGVGGDDLSAIGFDLSRSNTAVIAGSPRSGRSTALLCAVESLLRGGTDVVLAAPRPSPLRDLAGREGVRHVFTGSEITEEELRPLLESSSTPVVLVVDDGELLKDVAAKDYLRTVIRAGSDRGQALILGGESGEVGNGFSGWQVDAKGRQGALIAPQGVTDGELIGVRLPRSSVGAQAQAGRALANDGNGLLQTIQVPID